MNSEVLDQLVIVRHSLKVIREELEFVRMAARDLGEPGRSVPRMVALQHSYLMGVGINLKSIEESLSEDL